MEKTQQKAERAATKAIQKINKEVSLLSFDEIHTLKDTKKTENKCSKIIRKHIRDCYIASWITEAEEVEKMYGTLLLTSFLIRLAFIKEHGPDRKLIEDAERYVERLEINVTKHFETYVQQMNDIRLAPKDEQADLIRWRTGEHGTSGLGYRLDTIVRTENDTAQANASLDVYEEAGIEKYLFNAMMDDKTCKKCRALNGQIFKIEDKKEGVNFPIIHPRCRCYIEPIYDTGKYMNINRKVHKKVEE